MPSRPLHLGLVGATGAVGRAVLEALEDDAQPLASVRLFASERSAGSEVEFQGEPLKVEKLAPGALRGLDVAVFAVPADVARGWLAAEKGERCPVVDLSAAFRVEPDVPLVAADVNASAIPQGRARAIVACPGATALHLAVALKPLHDAARLERVSVTALQSASAAGRGGVEQLEREARALMNGIEPEAGTAIPHRLAFNLVPQAGSFGPSGYAEEELRIAAETRRVLDALEVPVAATVVRVPIFHAHAATVAVRLKRKLPAAEARDVLRRAPGVKVIDDPAQRVYPMPMLAVNDEAVLVGRIRDDLSQENGLELFVAGDNLKNGAALNALRIARIVAGRA